MLAYPKVSTSEVESDPVESVSPANLEILEKSLLSETLQPVKETRKLDKATTRSSLKASTWDGVFATIFSNITGGVLLSNFLLQLGGTPVEIGMLASVPMLVNLLQPVGAFLSERSTSRHWYGIGIFGPSRLLWLVLVLGIALSSWHQIDPHSLVILTLAMVLITHVMGSLGSASWLSWMAALVPVRLRGRYFGIRNSAANLTNLIVGPLLALGISAWPGGPLEGYGAILLVGVAIGIISLACQFWMIDINPQEQERSAVASDDRKNSDNQESNHSHNALASCLSPNFLKFLLYFSFWSFAMNVSSPFFNLYMLDNLGIDVSWVTIYNSLMAGAGLMMLVLWGKLADKIGNRPLLVMVGILVAVTPLLWLGMGADAVSVWVLFPLLHLLKGGTLAAIDLCNNNLQMAVAPGRHQATYFGVAAAVSGVAGAMGTTLGGFLAQQANYGGLPAMFVLSAMLRIMALLPLLFVYEPRSQSLLQLMGNLLSKKVREHESHRDLSGG